jgi:hypothetical protein
MKELKIQLYAVEGNHRDLQVQSIVVNACTRIPNKVGV